MYIVTIVIMIVARGGIWLCSEEEKNLNKVVKIYDSYFIDTFLKIRETDSIRFINKFSCPYLTYRNCKRCSIYSKRPFICRIIPVDISQNASNQYIWILRKYCLLYKYNKRSLKDILLILKQMTEEINILIDNSFLSDFEKVWRICFLNDSLLSDNDYIFVNKVRTIFEVKKDE